MKFILVMKFFHILVIRETLRDFSKDLNFFCNLDSFKMSYLNEPSLKSPYCDHVYFGYSLDYFKSFVF